MPPSLRDEQDLAGGFPSFERAMRLRRLRERKLVLDMERQLAGADPAEQLARAGELLLARSDVVVELRAGEVQRAARVQHLRIERCHGATRLSEEDHRAAWFQAAEALLERRL